MRHQHIRVTVSCQSVDVCSQPHFPANSARDAKIAATNDLQSDIGVEIEVSPGVEPRLGVGVAHEFVADQGDVERSASHEVPSSVHKKTSMTNGAAPRTDGGVVQASF
jgi:hypothetical protein